MCCQIRDKTTAHTHQGTTVNSMKPLKPLAAIAAAAIASACGYSLAETTDLPGVVVAFLCVVLFVAVVVLAGAWKS